MVKRYNPDASVGYERECEAYMEEAEAGAYVLHADYDTLRARLAEVEKGIHFTQRRAEKAIASLAKVKRKVVIAKKAIRNVRYRIDQERIDADALYYTLSKALAKLEET